MSVLRVFVVALFLLIASSFAAAAEKTGLDFLRECEGRGTPASQVGQLTCAAYLSGFIDSHALVLAQLPATWPRFCLPGEGVQIEQVMLIVTKWLRDNPSKLHESARSSIYIALAKAFPCRPQ